MKKEGMGIRLAAIDLDGTLLHDDMSISDRSKKAIHQAMERGIRIVIATGRMWRSAQIQVNLLDLGNVPVVCYTGSWIKMSESGETLLQEGLEPALASEILQEGRKQGWHATFLQRTGFTWISRTERRKSIKIQSDFSRVHRRSFLSSEAAGHPCRIFGAG